MKSRNTIEPSNNYRRMVYLGVLMCLLSNAVLAIPAPTADSLSSPQPASVYFSGVGQIPPALSPDGQRLAWIDADQQLQLGLTSAVNQAQRTIELSGSVQQLLWFDQRYLLWQSRLGPQLQWSLLDLHQDQTRELISWSADRGSGVELLQLQPREERLLISYDRDAPWVPGVYALDLTGQLTPVQTNPGDVVRWIPGADGRLRLAQSWHLEDGEPVYGVRYLPPRSSRWRSIVEHPLSVPEVRPLGFAGNGSIYLGQGSQLQLWSPRNGQTRTVLAEHALDQVTSLNWGRRGLAMVTMQGLQPRQLIIDQSWQARVDRLQQVAPDLQPQLLARAGDFTMWQASGDQEPGLTLLHNERDGSVQQVARALPDLGRQQLAPMLPFAIDAAGIELTGYLTKPAVAPGAGGHPFVVLVHGGPWARDYWGFSPEVQYLASRGYAVLQVNFRGSRGLNHELMMAGYRQWGRGMQDDLLHAVDWAVAEHGLDRDRGCIMGSSYGGYAALTGVLRDPNVFRCAIAFAPVTDLAAQMDAIMRSGNARGFAEWRYMLGEPDSLTALSPLAYASQLSRPVLLAHGDDDHVVAINQSEQFALAANDQVQLLRLAGAGHSLPSPAQQTAYYERVSEFLDQHLGFAAGVVGDAASPVWSERVNPL